MIVQFMVTFFSNFKGQEVILMTSVGNKTGCEVPWVGPDIWTPALLFWDSVVGLRGRWGGRGHYLKTIS